MLKGIWLLVARAARPSVKDRFCLEEGSDPSSCLLHSNFTACWHSGDMLVAQTPSKAKSNLQTSSDGCGKASSM